VRAPTKSLEQRIAECMPKALRIIRPEENQGLFSEYKHKWQHVEACKREIAAAICVIAAIELEKVGTKLRPNQQKVIINRMQRVERELSKISEPLAREQHELMAKVEAALAPQRQSKTTKEAQQKLAAVWLADNLMDYGEVEVAGATVQSNHARLAQLLYTAATGDATGLRRQVKEYFKEMVAPIREQVTDRAGRTRSRRRDRQGNQKITYKELDPSSEVDKMMWEDVQSRKRVWEQPKTDHH
jgi:hypothetical protein